MGRLRDRHVVVTGAGTGIGRAIAQRMGQEGARLTLLGRRVELLEQTAEAAAAAGAASVRVAGVDIRDRAAVDAAFVSAGEDFGPMYALVANAGVGGPNQDGDEDRFFDLVQTNLVGTYQTCRAALRQMGDDAPHARHLVVVASILGRFGVPGYTGYCASKTGLLGMVRAFSKEVAARDIQVNAICPGWVATEMAWEGIDGMAAGMGVTREEALKTAMSEVPLGRMSEPRDVAGVVAWLLGPDARGVTGQGIDINGGAWMG